MRWILLKINSLFAKQNVFMSNFVTDGVYKIENKSTNWSNRDERDIQKQAVRYHYPDGIGEVSRERLDPTGCPWGVVEIHKLPSHYFVYICGIRVFELTRFLKVLWKM